MEDAIKTGKDFCEEEQNDVKQSVADMTFYDEVELLRWSDRRYVESQSGEGSGSWRTTPILIDARTRRRRQTAMQNLNGIFVKVKLVHD